MYKTWHFKNGCGTIVILMRLFVRFLLWLLIAALPLQGGAVAFMLCNELAGNSGTSTSARQLDEGSQAQTMGSEHCGAGKRDHVADPHGKCSQCASCCIGAAAVPAMPKQALHPGFSASAISAVEPAMTVHFPATLERPPRSLASHKNAAVAG